MRRRGVEAIVLAVVFSSCLVDKPLEADPSLAAFVGDWHATSLVLKSVVAPRCLARLNRTRLVVRPEHPTERSLHRDPGLRW